MVVETDNQTEQSPLLVKVSTGREIRLRAQTALGRSADSDIQLSEGLASRRHAKITIEPDGVWLEDLNAANGTFVNGQRISGRVLLNPGDRLRFDVEEYDFRVPGALPTDGGATMYREPASAAVTAESSAIMKRPGAWADPDAMGDVANKTKFIDPSQLKQMMNSAPKETPETRAAIDGPHLQVASGGRAGLNIKLAVGDSGAREWSIGSSPEREVQFNDDGVSALHAKIVNEGARWKVLDQMSSNGTFVNGKRSNMSYLASGDRLRFGPVECVFHAPEGASRPAAAPRSEASAAGGGRTWLIAAGAFAVTGAVLFLVYKFVL